MHNIIKNLHEKLNIPKAGKQPRKTKFQISIISKLEIFGYFHTWENEILFYSNHINPLFLLLEAVLLLTPFIKIHYILYFNSRLEKLNLQFAHKKHENFHQKYEKLKSPFLKESKTKTHTLCKNIQCKKFSSQSLSPS